MKFEELYQITLGTTLHILDDNNLISDRVRSVSQGDDEDLHLSGRKFSIHIGWGQSGGGYLNKGYDRRLRSHIFTDINAAREAWANRLTKTLNTLEEDILNVE
ncbi:MAG: hypothetical protein KAJ19_17240 [Gammaproteobacteria bacterium]|nr:hypothetical protein [Gammaproteobacteria bacterium]